MHRRVIGLGLLLASWQAAGTEPPWPARPYAPADYRLAYDAFIQAGALRDALAVALKAVKADPGNRRWRQRLAQVALWLNRPHLALEQYTELVLEGETRHYTTAVKLARELQAYDQLARLYRYRLRLHPDDTQAFRGLIDALVELGEPEQAVARLWRRFHHHPSEDWLRRLAELYRDMDRPVEEYRVLRLQLDRFGTRLWAVRQLAILSFLQGNLEESYRVLKTHLPRLTRPDTPLVALYLDLAWLHQDYTAFYQGARRYQALMPPDMLPRLIFASRRAGELDEAFRIALGLWRRHADLNTALLLLAIANEDASGKLLDRLVPLLQQAALPRLHRHPLYLLVLSRWHYRHGRLYQARQVLERALREQPQNLSLLTDYLWLAVDIGQARSLHPWVPTLLRRALTEPQLRDPLIALLSLLDRPLEALTYANLQLAAKQNDPLWLINYADLLDQAERPDAARWWRLRALRLIRERAPADAVAFLRVLLAFDGGDPLAARILSLARHPESSGNPKIQDLMLIWSIARGDEPSRHYLFQTYWRHRHPPGWAALTHALRENDGDRLLRLLDGETGVLPRRDLVRAARRLRRDAWGFSQAFLRLEQVPDDWRLARQYRELVTEQADTFGCQWQYDNLQDAHWQHLNCRLGKQLAARLRLNLLSDHILTIDTDPTTWIGTPPRAGTERLELRHRSQWGKTTLTVGVRHALGQYWIAGLRHRYPISERLTLEAQAIHGNINYESLPLFLAGSSLDLTGGIEFTWNPRQQLRIVGGYRWFHDAEGHLLGRGWGWDAAHRYLWHGRNPQVSLTTSILWRDYQESAKLPQRLRQHLPGDAVNPGRAVVPKPYWQADITLDVDTTFQTGIPSRLRPYLSTRATWHSITGLGGGISMGVATQILGPDRLTLGFEFTRGAQGLQNNFSGLRLGYQFYF